MFKYKGKYYLITSGCTGWIPNEAMIASADSILGKWKIYTILAQDLTANQPLGLKAHILLRLKDAKMLLFLCQTDGIKQILKIPGMFGCLLIFPIIKLA
jgi:hypothetical protein